MFVVLALHDKSGSLALALRVMSLALALASWVMSFTPSLMATRSRPPHWLDIQIPHCQYHIPNLSRRLTMITSYLSFDVGICTASQQQLGGVRAAFVACPHQGRPASLRADRTRRKQLKGFVKEPNILIYFFFSAHHSIVFCFGCSVYWWNGSVRF